MGLALKKTLVQFMVGWSRSLCQQTHPTPVGLMGSSDRREALPSVIWHQQHLPGCSQRVGNRR